MVPPKWSMVKNYKEALEEGIINYKKCAMLPACQNVLQNILNSPLHTSPSVLPTITKWDILGLSAA